MSSLGGQDRKGKLVSVQIDLPTTVEGIVDRVREILLKGEVRSISIEDNKPITYQIMVQPGEEIAAEADVESLLSDLKLADIVRNNEMEEFNVREQGLVGVSAQTLFFWTYFFLEHEGLFPTYLLIGEESDFWTWLGLTRRMRKLLRLIGLRIERDKSIPSDTYLLCAAKHANADITEIVHTLKVSMGDTDARDDEDVSGARSNSVTDSSPAQDVEDASR